MNCKTLILHTSYLHRHLRRKAGVLQDHLAQHGHSRVLEPRAPSVPVSYTHLGMGGAKTQVMLCGIPNVGKSTFINTFAGSARAKAADRPGVTKGKQLSLIHIWSAALHHGEQGSAHRF